MLKEAVKDVVRFVVPPIARHTPVHRWPGWLGRTLDVKVPGSVILKRELSPAGQANINILFEMIERTKHLGGALADVGVYRGCSTLGMGLYLEQKGIKKTIYGFDSFEGFPKEANEDIALGGVTSEERLNDHFEGTSLRVVQHKIEKFGLKNIVLIPGYFDKVFATLAATELRFCFVHLDVNLYDSYRLCLEFFYPRMVSGGIILLDEYNDLDWPGCNKAADEFVLGKPEKWCMVQRDHYQKWFLLKA